ncbi:MAG: PcfJ domain-containing protein [Hyphomicrobiaceae bacterium]
MGVPVFEGVQNSCPVDIQSVIRRYKRPYRNRLATFAASHPACSDLVASFPVAAFYLIDERGPKSRRAAALELVKAGRPLKSVATALALPLWTRRLPPAAITPAWPAHLPPDGPAASRLVGCIPAEAKEIAPWLGSVTTCYHLGSEAFAVWAARTPAMWASSMTKDALMVLGLFAVVSELPEVPIAKLLDGRFNDRMSFAGACRAAVRWLMALEQELLIGSKGLADPWLAGGRASGYRFVPLVSVADLAAEADAMQTCVADYVRVLADGRCRLFSIRRGAVPVATLEIQRHWVHEGIPQIAQLRGPNNGTVGDHLWSAAFLWLAEQRRYALPSDAVAVSEPNADTWRELWRPVRRRFADHPLVPEVASGEALARLLQPVRDLTRWGKR